MGKKPKNNYRKRIIYQVMMKLLYLMVWFHVKNSLFPHLSYRYKINLISELKKTNSKKRLQQFLKTQLEMLVQVLIQEQLIRQQWKGYLHAFITEQKLISKIKMIKSNKIKGGGNFNDFMEQLRHTCFLQRTLRS